MQRCSGTTLWYVGTSVLRTETPKAAQSRMIHRRKTRVYTLMHEFHTNYMCIYPRIAWKKGEEQCYGYDIAARMPPSAAPYKTENLPLSSCIISYRAVAESSQLSMYSTMCHGGCLKSGHHMPAKFQGLVLFGL